MSAFLLFAGACLLLTAGFGLVLLACGVLVWFAFYAGGGYE